MNYGHFNAKEQSTSALVNHYILKFKHMFYTYILQFTALHDNCYSNLLYKNFINGVIFYRNLLQIGCVVCHSYGTLYLSKKGGKKMNILT